MQLTKSAEPILSGEFLRISYPNHFEEGLPVLGLLENPSKPHLFLKSKIQNQHLTTRFIKMEEVILVSQSRGPLRFFSIQSPIRVHGVCTSSIQLVSPGPALTLDLEPLVRLSLRFCVNTLPLPEKPPLSHCQHFS